MVTILWRVMDASIFIHSGGQRSGKHIINIDSIRTICYSIL